MTAAKSLLLSDSYYDPDTDCRPKRGQLEKIGEELRSGISPTWNERVLAKMVAEQDLLEQEGDPSWLRIIVLLLLIFAIPLLALLVFVARRLL